jgi:NADH dehydrogenase subunit N (EC 1.6.5.3)
VTALLQNNLKRMLAYSSIAHAGYLLVAVTAGGTAGASAALFYLAVYAVMNLGAFGVLTMMGRGTQEPVLMADIAGLGFRRPWLGLALTVFMLSLGGIPPTAGFMGKVYVFGTALQAGLVPLVIIGVLNSVVSIFYYLRVTVALYMGGAGRRAGGCDLDRAGGDRAGAGARAHAVVGRAGRRPPGPGAALGPGAAVGASPPSRRVTASRESRTSAVPVPRSSSRR